MHFEPKKYTKKYKMRVFQHKEDMISYYHSKKLNKKHWDAPKLGRNWSKMRKIGKKLALCAF